MASSWLVQLGQAERPHDVVWVAKEFVASWPPEDLSRIPACCRPLGIKGSEEIAELCLLLKQEQLRRPSADEEDEELDALERMMFFFEHASRRLAKLSRVH